MSQTYLPFVSAMVPAEEEEPEPVDTGAVIQLDSVSTTSVAWDKSSTVTEIKSSKFTAFLKGSIKVVTGATADAIAVTSDQTYVQIKLDASSAVSDLVKAVRGVTVSFRMRVSFIEEGKFIFSSGGERSDSYGMALVYQYGAYQAIVSTKTKQWQLSLTREQIKVNRWQKVEFSYSETLGVSVYINRILVAWTNKYIERDDDVTVRVSNIFIGRSSEVTTDVSVSSNSSVLVQGIQFFDIDRQKMERAGLTYTCKLFHIQCMWFIK